jgi:hypothetical protein
VSEPKIGDSCARRQPALIIIGVVWIGYTAWPLYDLFVLVRAIETRDIDTVTRQVYFDAVRISLTIRSLLPTYGAAEARSVRSRKAWPLLSWALPIQ